MAITIAGFEFPNQTRAKAFVQSLIRECPAGGITPEADTMLRMMLAETPDIQRTRGRPFRLKIEQGMHVIVTGIFEPFRFSWNGAIKAKPHRMKVTLAAREMVKHQRPPADVIAHPDCALCGQPFAVEHQSVAGGRVLTRAAEPIHQDHHPVPFVTIWTDWLASEGLTEDAIPLIGETFDDTDQCIRWMDYHEAHACFQPTHARCNLTKRDDR